MAPKTFSGSNVADLATTPSGGASGTNLAWACGASVAIPRNARICSRLNLSAPSRLMIQPLHAPPRATLALLRLILYETRRLCEKTLNRVGGARVLTYRFSFRAAQRAFARGFLEFESFPEVRLSL